MRQPFYLLTLLSEKRSNFLKNEVDAYFVHEGKICRVKPMKEN